jgi:hypothetical protein
VNLFDSLEDAGETVPRKTPPHQWLCSALCRSCAARQRYEMRGRGNAYRINDIRNLHVGGVCHGCCFHKAALYRAETDATPRCNDVCFASESRHPAADLRCPLSANSGHGTTYSITSSARARSVGGTVRPSNLAVLRLMTNSYLVGACTGRPAGFSPLRMRST